MRRVRHKKRGSEYVVLGEAEGQISRKLMLEPISGEKLGRFIAEGDRLTVYRGEDGRLWWRFPEERP